MLNRLRLRPTHASHVLMLLPMALFVASGTTVALSWITYAVLAPAPTEQDAVDLAVAVTGQVPRNDPGGAMYCPLACMDAWDPAGDQVRLEDFPFDRNNGLDQVRVGFWTPDDEMPALVETSSARLEALGWAIRPSKYPGWIEAHRAGRAVFLQATPRASMPVGPAIVRPPVSLLLRLDPPLVVGNLVAAVSLLAGGLAGWLLTGWVIRQYRGHSRRRRVAIEWAGALAMLFAILHIVTTALIVSLLLAVLFPDRLAFLVMMSTRNPANIVILTPGLVAAVATVVLAGLPRRRIHSEPDAADAFAGGIADFGVDEPVWP